jgi:hypothetical protein
LGVFKWRKFKLGSAKIGMLIQIEMGTQEKNTRIMAKTPTFFVFWKYSGLEV